MKQALIKITGKVQGVSFRAHAQEAAKKLGLSGYAKNMEDGSVEVLLQGEETAIKQFIEWCNTGSPGSKAEQVQLKWEAHETKIDGFSTL